jgi:hypothetical protein
MMMSRAKVSFMGLHKIFSQENPADTVPAQHNRINSPTR